jgi:hypothetical protein
MAVHTSQPVVQIPNTMLVESDLPPVDADWDEIGRFAATFYAELHPEQPPPGAEGEENSGVYPQASRVFAAYEETGRWTGTLTALRTCLYGAWRLLYQRDIAPKPSDLHDLRSLIETIRLRVRAGDID